MSKSVSVIMGLLLSFCFLGPVRAEDPGSFLDLRLSVAPYSRMGLGSLRDVSLGLSLGMWRHGFVGFEMDWGLSEWKVKEGFSYRAFAGGRFRAVELLDYLGNGLLVESSLALGYQHSILGYKDSFIRLSLDALYWFWNGRLAVGLDLSGGLFWSSANELQAALVTAVAFPWYEVGSVQRRLALAEPVSELPDAPHEAWMDLRLRLSPPFSRWEMPYFQEGAGINVSATFWEYLLVDYSLDFTEQPHSSDLTAAHTLLLGGRLRILNFRDDKGEGAVVAGSLALGYSYYLHDIYDDELYGLQSLCARMDFELLYWFNTRFGMGLWAAAAFYLPVFMEGRDLPEPHPGAGGALVLAFSF